MKSNGRGSMRKGILSESHKLMTIQDGQVIEKSDFLL